MYRSRAAWTRCDSSISAPSRATSSTGCSSSRLVVEGDVRLVPEQVVLVLLDVVVDLAEGRADELDLVRRRARRRRRRRRARPPPRGRARRSGRGAPPRAHARRRAPPPPGRAGRRVRPRRDPRAKDNRAGDGWTRAEARHRARRCVRRAGRGLARQLRAAGDRAGAPGRVRPEPVRARRGADAPGILGSGVGWSRAGSLVDRVGARRAWLGGTAIGAARPRVGGARADRRRRSSRRCSSFGDRVGGGADRGDRRALPRLPGREARLGARRAPDGRPARRGDRRRRLPGALRGRRHGARRSASPRRRSRSRGCWFALVIPSERIVREPGAGGSVRDDPPHARASRTLLAVAACYIIVLSGAARLPRPGGPRVRALGADGLDRVLRGQHRRDGRADRMGLGRRPRRRRRGASARSSRSGSSRPRAASSFALALHARRRRGRARRGRLRARRARVERARLRQRGGARRPVARRPLGRGRGDRRLRALRRRDARRSARSSTRSGWDALWVATAAIALLGALLARTAAAAGRRAGGRLRRAETAVCILYGRRSWRRSSRVRPLSPGPPARRPPT